MALPVRIPKEGRLNPCRARPSLEGGLAERIVLPGDLSLPAVFPRGWAGGSYTNATTLRRTDGQEERRAELREKLMRYRILERETTDPVASGLLHEIVSELESDLKTTDCSGR
jgi:hypothetical protein